MWQRGRKLTPEELKAAPQTVGHLDINPRAAALRLEDEGPTTLLPFLFDPRLTRMRGDEFVIAGHETVPGGKVGDRWPQTWWCRLEPVSPASGTGAPGGSAEFPRAG